MTEKTFEFDIIQVHSQGEKILGSETGNGFYSRGNILDGFAPG
jgi:hypothetical protein